jgi:hypothetical protein
MTISKRDKIRLMLKINKSNPADAIEGFLIPPANAEGGIVDQEHYDRMRKKVSRINRELSAKFLDKQIDIYDSILSEEAVDAAIAFYSSPAGVEMSDKMGEIDRQLSALGMAMANELRAMLVKELQEENPGFMVESDFSEMGQPPTVNPIDQEEKAEQDMDDFMKRYGLKDGE